ncbi:MAG: NAD-dependent epimerase/dehydratase family protein [Cyanothece sp. SIO2G6]|nr:NAD-dependent epimerase/dehydratase family protein [Cyanothece sp. SIO2G6]
MVDHNPDILNLLERLTQAGVTLWSDNGQLRFRSPKGALTPDLKKELQQHKQAILISFEQNSARDTPSSLNLSGFYQKPTLESLNQLISQSLKYGTEKNAIGAAATTEELLQEAIAELQNIPSSVTFTPSKEDFKAVFLTGATGFLGVYLLHELLEQTQAVIYCLVRAPNLNAGQDRLQTKLSNYGLWQDKYKSRIITVLGDLADPLLGLSPAQFQHLTQTIDIIYHNGALVNFAYPYSALKSANVSGTREILTLATTHKIKPLHYISTIGVFLSSHLTDNQIVYEQDSLDHGGTLYGGYSQSKWVAEKLVTLASERGVPVSIYRPGTITGHSQTGICSTQDWLSLTIKSAILLKTLPALDAVLEMSPVDYVSRSILYLSQQPTSLYQRFHLVNPHPCPWHQLADFLSAFGYQTQLSSFEQWTQQLSTYTVESSDSLAGLLPILQSHGSGSSQIRFNSDNTIQALAKSEISCPPISAQLLRSQLSYFVNHDFLPAPTTSLVN